MACLDKVRSHYKIAPLILQAPAPHFGPYQNGLNQNDLKALAKGALDKEAFPITLNKSSQSIYIDLLYITIQIQNKITQRFFQMMMMTRIAPFFQGIARYDQNSEQVARSIFDTHQQRDHICAVGVRTGESFVLTGNDMAQLMQEHYGMSIPPALLAIQTPEALFQALRSGSTALRQAAAIFIDFGRKLMGNPSELDMLNEKVLTYVEARQAAGSDIDGQPIVNITV